MGGERLLIARGLRSGVGATGSCILLYNQSLERAQEEAGGNRLEAARNPTHQG